MMIDGSMLPQIGDTSILPHSTRQHVSMCVAMAMARDRDRDRDTGFVDPAAWLVRCKT